MVIDTETIYYKEREKRSKTVDKQNKNEYNLIVRNFM